MDAIDLFRIGLRRWYVAVPAALLALVAAFTARSSVDLTYKSTGSLLLFAPKEGTVAKNRLLAFNSLNVPASVSSQVVGDAATREKLKARGASPDYRLGLDPSNPAPLVMAEATGGIKQAPLTVQLVLDEVSADLERRQIALGAPPETWITTEVVTPPTPPLPQSGSRTRAFIAVLLLGMGIAAGLTIGVDLLADRRKKDGSEYDSPARGNSTVFREPAPAYPNRDAVRTVAVATQRQVSTLPPPPAPGPPRMEPSPSPQDPPDPPPAAPTAETTPRPLPDPVAPVPEPAPFPRPHPAGLDTSGLGTQAIPIRRRHPYLVTKSDDDGTDDITPPARKSGTD